MIKVFQKNPFQGSFSFNAQKLKISAANMRELAIIFLHYNLSVFSTQYPEIKTCILTRYPKIKTYILSWLENLTRAEMDHNSGTSTNSGSKEK